VLDYNDAAGLERAFAEMGNEIAAVIVEPVAGNMNLVAPKREFLDALRSLCTKHGAVLILDEVMTGFRVSLQGAQDITASSRSGDAGQVMGGDCLQRPSVVDAISCNACPSGGVSGSTLSGNPVAWLRV